ncbi:Cytochrome c-551 precursor [compost metagenome]
MATPAPTAQPQATVSAASSTEKAQLLYKNNCLACHGAGLTGDYGPNLTKVGARRTKEQITNQIMNGKVEMPPFKDTLKADEVEALANWLAAMK